MIPSPQITAAPAGEGVDTSAVQIDATRPTGVFFREWLADGAWRVFYYRSGSAAANTAEDLRAEQFVGIKALHLTGITPALSGAGGARVRGRLSLPKRRA
jgi:2-dehydro-3-deoxygluconokinase